MSYRAEETHTPASSDGKGPADHCVECSVAAQEWVSWPCSRAKLVRAVADRVDYLAAMDEADRLEDAYQKGYQDAKEAKKRGLKRFLPSRGLKRAKNG